MERRGSNAYSQFVSVLKESETYSRLGQLLESEPGGGVINDEKYGMYIYYMNEVNSVVVLATFMVHVILSYMHS